MGERRSAKGNLTPWTWKGIAGNGVLALFDVARGLHAIAAALRSRDDDA
jgi:hypothetical protein